MTLKAGNKDNDEEHGEEWEEEGRKEWGGREARLCPSIRIPWRIRRQLYRYSGDAAV